MKVALCLSGHMRDFRQTFPSIKHHILDKFDTDVFISTWSEPGYWSSDDEKGVENYDRKFDNLNIDILDLYNPVLVDIEDFSSYKNTFIEISESLKKRCNRRWGRPISIVSMYYKIYRCNDIKNKYVDSSRVNYDLVIRCRPDVNINFYTFSITATNTIQVQLLDGVLNDVIFCGDSNSMDKLCSTYINLDCICREDCLLDPHDILEKSISFFNLKRQIVNGSLSIINTPGGYCKGDIYDTIEDYMNKNEWDSIFNILQLNLVGSYEYFNDEYYLSTHKQRFYYMLNRFGPRYFKDKTIVELGGSVGILSNALSILGAKPTVYEGRLENIRKGMKKYPHIEFVHINLDDEDFTSKNYDIVLNFGVFYHILNFDKFIKSSYKIANELLLLDGNISTDSDISLLIKLERDIIDTSLTNRQCLCSPSYMEHVLSECKDNRECRVTRIVDDIDRYPGSTPYKYRDGNRSFWEVVKL